MVSADGRKSDRHPQYAHGGNRFRVFGRKAMLPGTRTRRTLRKGKQTRAWVLPIGIGQIVTMKQEPIQNKIVVIVGKPGSGKTLMASYLMSHYERQYANFGVFYP